MSAKTKKKILEWCRAAFIRAIRTFAQTTGSLITIGGIIKDTDWKLAFSAGAVAFVYSLIMSIAGLPEVKLPELKFPEEKE